MNHRISVMLVSLGLAACATNGQESTNPETMQLSDAPIAADAVAVKHNVPAAAKESGLVDENTLVCKKEKVVGSHIPRTVCLSAKDRENIQRISRSAVGIGKRTAQPSPPEG